MLRFKKEMQALLECTELSLSSAFKKKLKEDR